ncbi:MAG: valine--tRNA ligase [Candidatus Saccharibacteria bacterium]|nr:valine--tRNA ligase [Candidatus Saccharibacteria bacterium]
MKLPKLYEPSQYETDIYAMWEKAGVFEAQPDKEADRFSISMPPPNATGHLHVGHALGIALQDTMVRYNRMQGKDVLWLPGTDHAALATNAIMEKRLADEGTNKHEIGREAFVDRLKEFIEGSRGTIRGQIRAMGASCDWSRERYTLDSALNRCVNETFVKMYNDGLIYRGHRIVNWDPNLETTVADDEVVHVEETGQFYTFQYGPFQISTARPETKFGDKYVVMHPDDKRYKQYKHGDTFEAEWINGQVTATIIKDEAVDPKFGTGVMTITPWHDHTDFDIAERHNLDKVQIIDFHGKLMPIAGEFAGMTIAEGRRLVVKKLNEKGLLVKTEDNYSHSVAVNDRGKGIIEPQIKLQWFVDVNKPVVDWKGKKSSLKEVMQAVVRDGDVDIVPARFDKLYFSWIDNLRDWCISRQIWWGHRIPVWYRTNAEDEVQTFAGVQPPEDDQSEGWHEWEQDPDTLDTWFSSALWTWSTLIDPSLASNFDMSMDDILNASPDFKAYHPTSVLETGWDIIFFWVARMILTTTYMIGEVPFKTVYLHGLVRAEDGQKMSKSKPETTINPMDVIPVYGTDALRLALLSGVSPGNDQRMSIAKITAQRNFCNKLWNIARFVEDKLGDDFVLESHAKATNHADHWLLTKLQQTTDTIASDLENFRFAEAYDKLYHFVWDDFADWYVEASKMELNPQVLAHSLQSILIIAHPFAPFITETIWQTLAWQGDSMLAVAPWPATVKTNPNDAKVFDEIIVVVTEVRSLMTELNLHGSKLYYHNVPFLKENAELIKKLTKLKDVIDVESGLGLQLVQTKYKAWLDVDSSTIKAHQLQLKEQQARLGDVVKSLEARLANKNYVKQAPKAIVDQTKDQLSENKQLLDKIAAQQARFAAGN